MRTKLTVIMTLALVTAFLTMGVSYAAPGKVPGAVHVVQWGENLASIAYRYGTTVEALAQANGLTDPNLVYIGQQLVVPTAAGMPAGGTPPGGKTPSGKPPTVPSGPQAVSPAPGASTYTVRFGDTLTSIAFRFGTTVKDLMRANGLSNGTIYIGQQLKIRGAKAAPSPQGIPNQVPAAYTVQAGDTLSAIAFRFGITVSDVMQMNNLYSPWIFPGQRLAIPVSGVAMGFEQPAGTYYTIRAGDTLAGVALRHRTTVPAILQANNLSQSQFIFPGQQLVIPGMMMNPSGTMPGAPMMGPSTDTQPFQGNAPLVSPAAPPGQGPMVGPGIAPGTGPSVAPLFPPGSGPSGMSVPPGTDGFGPALLMPMPPPGSSGIAPPVAPEALQAPVLTLKWEGHVVSQTQPEGWIYPSVLRVSVGGAVGMQITVSKKNGPNWSTTGFTGTKPEYGPGAAEFAPLNPGTHIISLDGQGFTMQVNIKPNSLTYVDIARVPADTGP
jgi:LysM repeat protein